ncbi:MAG TPA: ABC transporter ATP-binding protein [Clostridia bacterium]|nr:ABC transporter ATP-binding protein [Clostridia bacterium]
MESNKILNVQNLSVAFASFGESVTIVDDVSFHIDRGETVGIVGESGCGKSMTALAIMRLIQPPGVIRGKVEIGGRNLLSLSEREMHDVRGNEISMIFQEPMTSLNPVITIGKQLMEVFITHQKCSRAQAWKQSVEVLRLVKIALPEQRMGEYPYQLSGGMRQRVMIAMALSCKPKLLIADEPTTALDVTIQAQILRLMRELREKTGSSIMLITHDLGVVSEVCSRAIIFYCGRIVEEAPVAELFAHPLHPYTEGLLRSLPVRGGAERLYVIPGSVPGLNQLPEGCVFHPRCAYADERCRTQAPEIRQAGPQHYVRCWRQV